MKFPLLAALLPPLFCVAARAQEAASNGVPVTYQLPADLAPGTYRVTLAIVDATDPNWVISTFVAGAPRQVTTQNKGRFTDVWNGLDDNGMPVAPGTYALKGVWMPAQQWLDGQWHSLVPRYRLAAGDSWGATAAQDDKFPQIFGHDFGSMHDVAVGPNGRTAFLGAYLENAYNPFLVDLNRPIGYDQVLAKYPSGGAAGGDNVATDGEMIWLASTNGGGEPYEIKNPDGDTIKVSGDYGRFVLRADREWGEQKSTWGARGVWMPAPVSSLAARKWGDKRLLYVTQPAPENKIVVLNGDAAKDAQSATVASLHLGNPRAVCVVEDGSRLAALYQNGGQWTVGTVALREGLPQGEVKTQFVLPPAIAPVAMQMANDGTTYVCDRKAGQVTKFDASGKIVHRFAKAKFESGPFNPDAFLAPRKLALWRDARGQQRLIIVEGEGPGRISEWTTQGQMIRQWFLSQNSTNGYALDPADASRLYAVTHSGYLTRYRIDVDKGSWDLEDVWEMPIGGKQYPRVINKNGRKYIAFAGGYESNWAYSVYRLEGDRCIAAAGVLGNADGQGGKWWHDENGDGAVEENEKTGDAGFAKYSFWGDNWLEDLSLAALDGADGRTWLRLAPTSYDAHGNPVFRGTDWQKLLTDPVFAARAEAKNASFAAHSGQIVRAARAEVSDSFTDWARIVGVPGRTLYIADANGPGNAGGIDTAGGHGSQFKLSRYDAGQNGYGLRWRVGRKAFRLAAPGEVYASQQMGDPVYGIVGVFDSNGLYHLYSQDGLCLDTLMIDPFRHGMTGAVAERAGAYIFGGESWYGKNYLDPKTGRVLLLMGRAQYSLYDVPNWKPGFVKPLVFAAPTVTLRAAQIAPPTELALAARGGIGNVGIARFALAPPGGPALDGSARGWEGAPQIAFGLDEERRVQVQTLYDRSAIYLRWHLRAPTLSPAGPGDVRRVFTHERRADTLSFYLQGDPNAAPGGAEGRAGDARIVFSLVKEANGLKPQALAMIPVAPGAAPSQAATYASPVGRADFDRVFSLDAKMGLQLDDDGRGFVLAAAIPRAVIGGALAPGARTTADFAATLGGVTNFWWANVGGLSNTATTDEPSEARLYPGAWGLAQFEGESIRSPQRRRPAPARTS